MPNENTVPSPPRTLTEVVHPLQPARFLRASWGKRFVHLRGPKGKFAGLMPWEALNSILTHHTLPESQLMLWRSKQLLKLPTFKHRIQKLRTPEVLDELGRGATLVLNAAETCFGPLRDLTDELQAELRGETFANLYASWKTEPGFGVHRDTQHTLILQVHGRKRWTVYPPTPTEPGRSARPLWSGVLEDGEMLHIPKGFWHFVVPVDEPSLHLTVSVLPTEPGELLQWVATQAVDDSRWQPGSDVPVVGSEVERKRWIQRMRKQLARAFTDDVIERFLEHREAAVPDRPRLAFPALGPSRIGLDTPIRLSRPRLHIVRAGPDRISLRCGDCTWSMAKPALPALKTLSDHEPHTLRELLEQHDLGRLTASMKELFQDLAKHRVITVVRR